jgi:hypothetical protein
MDKTLSQQTKQPFTLVISGMMVILLLSGFPEK